jgi:MFS family permease
MTSSWTSKIYRHGLFITLAAGFWGVAVIFFGFADSLWMGLLFLAMAGFFDMISGIFRGAIWNQTIPNHLRGRLAGIEMISYMTGPMLGNAEAGILAHYMGVKFSIVTGGILTVVGTVVLALFLPKFIRYHSSDGMKLKQSEEEQRNSQILDSETITEQRKFSEDSY